MWGVKIFSVLSEIWGGFVSEQESREGSIPVFLAEILEKALKLSAAWIAARFECASHEDFLHIFDNQRQHLVKYFSSCLEERSNSKTRWGWVSDFTWVQVAAEISLIFGKLQLSFRGTCKLSYSWILYLFLSVPVKLCCSNRFLFMKRMPEDHFSIYSWFSLCLRISNVMTGVFLLDFHRVGSVVSQGLSLPLFGAL